MHQPIPIKFGLAEQLIPVVRRVAAFEHFSKDAVGVIAAFIGALGVVIIDPGVTYWILSRLRKRRARRTVSGTVVW